MIPSKKEKEILYDVRVIGNQEIPWNIPLDMNLKKTISIGIKCWNLNKNIVNFSSKHYNSFLTAKNTRNRLTHPRKYYDIEISNEEMEYLLIAFDWLKDIFTKILKEKINSILKTVPDDFVKKFRIEALKKYPLSIDAV